MAIPKEDLTNEDEGHKFVGARIEILDWDTKTCVQRIDYEAPPEHLGDGCSLKFTGGCAYRGRWFQTSGTELVIYRLSDWSIDRVISHRSFNDLHGVAVDGDEMVVVNTGIEALCFLDWSGEIVREVNLASTPTWERFDRSFDYRRIGTTKPHEVHVNHAFRLDGDWWATRCIQRDAVNVERPDDRINIEVGQPHDGIIRGDFIYFTTTNARLVIANVATRKVEEILDLNRMNDSGGRIGWCRGLEVEGDVAYVGFTRLRRSKWAGVFDSVKDVARGRKRSSHIERIDLKRKVVLDSYDHKRNASSAIFTLMNYDRVIGAETNHAG